MPVSNKEKILNTLEEENILNKVNNKIKKKIIYKS